MKSMSKTPVVIKGGPVLWKMEERSLMVKLTGGLYVTKAEDSYPLDSDKVPFLTKGREISLKRNSSILSKSQSPSKTGKILKVNIPNCLNGQTHCF